MKTRKHLLTIIVVMLLGASIIAPKAAAATKIDIKTFRNNYLITSINIGSDVMLITDDAFRNLINLKSITVSENNSYYASYSNCLYNKDLTELICFPPALTGAYIPDSVVSIHTYALHGVPEGLKASVRGAIESHAADNQGEWDFPGANFVHVNGRMRWKREDGSVVLPNSQLMGLASEVVGECTNSSMKRSEQLERCFNQLVNTLSYERSTVVPTGDWVKEYAQNTLGSKKGNCYGYAASFAYIAKGLGYDARVCTGTVTSALGGRTAHAWTEVKLGDQWYIFDAEMQDAKGSGYYKQTYESYPAGPLEKLESYTVSFSN